MSNEDYNAGRYGGVYSGNDWGAYNQGRWDRERWQQATGPSGNSGGGGGPVGGGGGGGGGGGLGLIVVLAAMLFVLIAALLVALWAALAAVVAGLLLMGVVRIWSRSTDLSFPFAFRTAFYALLAHMGVSFAISAGIYLLLYNGIGLGFFQDIGVAMQAIAQAALDNMLRRPDGSATLAVMSAVADHAREHLAVLVKGALVLWGPGMLVSGAVFSRRLGPRFRGLRGYAMSVLTALLTIAPGLLTTNIVLVRLAERAQVAQLGTEMLTAAAIVAGLAVLGYALLGGLVAAIVLYIAMRMLVGKAALSLGRSYGTFVLGFLVYGLTTAAALYLFRNGDPLMQWMYGIALSPDPLGAAWANAGTLLPALQAFLPLQLPGLLLCAGIVTSRVGPAFHGFAGYGKAIVVSGVLALLILLPFLCLAIMGVAGKLMQGTGFEVV